MDWYLKVLKNYVGFSGRARRKEYWMFALISFVIAIALAIIDTTTGLGFLGMIYGLAVLLPSLAVGARRLHDTGRTGWWLLIGLVPIIGLIVLLVFFVLEGTSGPNEYGPDPKAVGDGDRGVPAMA